MCVCVSAPACVCIYIYVHPHTAKINITTPSLTPTLHPKQTKPNLRYLDVSHGGWLGWEHSLQDYLDIIDKAREFL